MKTISLIKQSAKNILCDRDGTIIYDRHYLSDPGGVELLPGAAAGLSALYKSGADIFVVTNQSGIGRGLFSLQEYQACAEKLQALLESAGINLAGTAFCPHVPEEECNCRKPGPGMWNFLQNKFRLEARSSIMIGDKAEDIAFGHRLAFAKSILVLTGKGEETARKIGISYSSELFSEGFFVLPHDKKNHVLGHPDVLAWDLSGAAAYILSNFTFSDAQKT